MKTYACDHAFSFRKPVCPYCGGKLTATANEWSQEPDGTWAAETLDVNCDSEPDIDSDEWEGWWAEHSMDYCADWRATHDKLIAYLKRTARFDLSDHIKLTEMEQIRAEQRAEDAECRRTD